MQGHRGLTELAIVVVMSNLILPYTTFSTRPSSASGVMAMKKCDAVAQAVVVQSICSFRAAGRQNKRNGEQSLGKSLRLLWGRSHHRD